VLETFIAMRLKETIEETEVSGYEGEEGAIRARRSLIQKAEIYSQEEVPRIASQTSKCRGQRKFKATRGELFHVVIEKETRSKGVRAWEKEYEFLALQRSQRVDNVSDLSCRAHTKGARFQC
jgi:hypothetical protein